MARPDPHSAFDDAQPRVRRLDWRARLDFGARVIAGEARLTIDGVGAAIDLDARDLTIEHVGDEAGARLDVELGAPRGFAGQRLRIARPPRVVVIRYRTSPAAMALHWSNQSVYSQCQPIYARTLVPLPDSPSSPIAYHAELTAPRALTTLMAATRIDRVEAGDAATTTFAMDEPIAPYLLAVAVGDYAARELSARCRVWAAPALVDAAARALGDVERLLGEAEGLFGAYRWGRFDLLIAPLSFPYGGMENPRLAFLSPTLLGDRESLVAVVAHELVHAWSGNLVTAASAEHFWINEAFTVWGERRLVATLLGEAAARAHAA
ncbi:MAG TPA: M1 family aminopeptidase, partial [Polyangia bacterium]